VTDIDVITAQQSINLLQSSAKFYWEYRSDESNGIPQTA